MHGARRRLTAVAKVHTRASPRARASLSAKYAHTQMAVSEPTAGAPSSHAAMSTGAENVKSTIRHATACAYGKGNGVLAMFCACEKPSWPSESSWYTRLTTGAAACRKPDCSAVVTESITHCITTNCGSAASPSARRSPAQSPPMTSSGLRRCIARTPSNSARPRFSGDGERAPTTRRRVAAGREARRCARCGGGRAATSSSTCTSPPEPRRQKGVPAGEASGAAAPSSSASCSSGSRLARLRSKRSCAIATAESSEKRCTKRSRNSRRAAARAASWSAFIASNERSESTASPHFECICVTNVDAFQ